MHSTTLESSGSDCCIREKASCGTKTRLLFQGKTLTAIRRVARKTERLMDIAIRQVAGQRNWFVPKYRRRVANRKEERDIERPVDIVHVDA